MSRKSEFQNENPNPAAAFLEWKSEKKCFSYWDKEKEQNIEVKLPFKFLTLKEMHTVKGWHDASESAIYSNEVKYISNEPLNVRSFKGGEIAKGLYSEIKEWVKNAGGRYVKSIYIMTPDGEILNLQLKGSAVKAWGDFTGKSKARLYDEWVIVEQAEELQKGSIKYSIPVFTYASSLSQDEGAKADQVYATLEMYMKAYLSAPEEEKIVEAEITPEEEDDLPF